MTATLRKSAPGIAVVLLLLGLARPASAQGDQVGFARAITVAPGETRGDIACMRCSVYVRGTVKGDIAAIDGQVIIEGTVTGDTALVWGDIRLGDAAHVGGDIAVFGGAVKRSPTATVRGDVAEFTRKQAMAAILFSLAVCFILFALLVWLVVWLIRRGRTAPVQQQVVRRA